ncbi:dicarboxylate/amino acid:cation symporter [Nonomuraea muscovyensis]
MKNKAAISIAAALVLGVGVGLGCHHLTTDDAVRVGIIDVFDTIAHLFLNLVKMVIAPLIFATIVSGIINAAKSGLGKIFVRSMLWFTSASVLAGLAGFAVAHLLGVGEGLHLRPTGEDSGLEAKPHDPGTFLVNLVPQSFVKALAENQPMQILIFAMFFGAALLSLKKEGGNKIGSMIDELTAVMLRMTGYVMILAPLGVFAAVASAFTDEGFEAFATYGSFIATFYGALAGLWVVMLGVAVLFLGRAAFRLVVAIREPMFIAFSTASTEAAFPRLIESLTKFGVDRRTTGFVLPMGYAFNLDGSMLYMTFAGTFLINAYDLDLSIGQQLLMVLVLLISSKGMAGVPRGALVIVAAVVPGFGVPAAGVALLLVIDQILDMGRTATNCLGNGIATAVIGRNVVDPHERDDDLPRHAEPDRPRPGQRDQELIEPAGA